MSEHDNGDTADEQYPSEPRARNVMGEHNPDTWEVSEDDAERYFTSGEVNVWDPIEGEGFNEPGHWAHRDADMDAENARRLALRGEFDGEEYLPLISSDMRGVPTEGVQGSYSCVTRLDDPCPECEHEYGVRSVITMAGVGGVRCLTCDYEIHGF